MVNGASHRWLWFVRGLAVVALVLAGVLLSMAQGSEVLGCGPKSSCHNVLTSRWASWRGIPVSAIALAAYAGFLLSTFGLTGEAEARRTKVSWGVASFLAVSILFSAAWYVLVQLLLIKEMCPFCMGAHVCGGLASVIVLWKAPYLQAMLK